VLLLSHSSCSLRCLFPPAEVSTVNRKAALYELATVAAVLRVAPPTPPAPAAGAEGEAAGGKPSGEAGGSSEAGGGSDAAGGSELKGL
jgi:hypothetical protein